MTRIYSELNSLALLLVCGCCTAIICCVLETDLWKSRVRSRHVNFYVDRVHQNTRVIYDQALSIAYDLSC